VVHNRRYQAKNILEDYIVPSEHRQAIRERNRISAANTFEVIARKWFAQQEPGVVYRIRGSPQCGTSARISRPSKSDRQLLPGAVIHFGRKTVRRRTGVGHKRTPEKL